MHFEQIYKLSGSYNICDRKYCIEKAEQEIPIKYSNDCITDKVIRLCKYHQIELYFCFYFQHDK